MDKLIDAIIRILETATAEELKIIYLFITHMVV